MENILKTSLFALLVLSLAVPFTADAQGYTNKTYDPIVVNYLESVIYNATTSTVKTSGNHTMTIDTQSLKTADNTYSLIQDVAVDGKNLPTQNFSVTVNSDKTYRVVNDSINLDEVFTDEKPDRVKRGTGTYNQNQHKATISLYDREYGTPGTLKLYDNYSACLTLNQAVFNAPVKSSTIDVTWEASPFYFHQCISPLSWDSGVIQYGTDKHYLSSGSNQSDRRGSHTFTNYSVGTTWYSVSATFYYE